MLGNQYENTGGKSIWLLNRLNMVQGLTDPLPPDDRRLWNLLLGTSRKFPDSSDPPESTLRDR